MWVKSMDLTIYDLPLSGNLSIIETTEGLNGYPKNTTSGVVGFESFEDAELFAKRHNLDEFVLENLNCYGDSRFKIMSNQVMQFNYDCDQNIIGVF
jgi:hypothetical protein